MKVTGISWTGFRLPLRTLFQTADGEMTYREGLVLRLATDAGVVGLGEASAHPAAGPGAAREIDEALTRLAPHLVGAEVSCLDELASGAPPALTCALDTASCDAMAKARDVTVAQLLGGGARTSVPVNATIAAASEAEAASQAKAAREAGFACVKLKVATASNVEEERRRVAAVRHALGSSVRLRIDANGAWDVEGAIVTIQALEEYALELVEQPVRPGDLEGMARVRRAVGTPIAADEDVTGLDAARRVLEARAAQLLVLKLMVVGGLRPARQIAELASAAGVAVVVTTTIDAGVGTAAALHLAATLPEDGPACGLATGSLFVDDLVVPPLAVRNGWMELPGGPGLGVELDGAKLARYGGVEKEVA